jgi:hypothetical protein
VPKVDFYAMTKDRTLIKIEQAMDIASSVSLTWVVYEAAIQTGTYSKISLRSS